MQSVSSIVPSLESGHLRYAKSHCKPHACHHNCHPRGAAALKVYCRPKVTAEHVQIIKQCTLILALNHCSGRLPWLCAAYQRAFVRWDAVQSLLCQRVHGGIIDVGLLAMKVVLETNTHATLGPVLLVSHLQAAQNGPHVTTVRMRLSCGQA